MLFAGDTVATRGIGESIVDDAITIVVDVVEASIGRGKHLSFAFTPLRSTAVAGSDAGLARSHVFRTRRPCITTLGRSWRTGATRTQKLTTIGRFAVAIHVAVIAGSNGAVAEGTFCLGVGQGA